MSEKHDPFAPGEWKQFPGYNTSLPQDVHTPDRVKTSIGKLNFDDGRPKAKTVAQLYRYLDTARAVEAYLNNMGAVSTEMQRLVHDEMGGEGCNHILIGEQLTDANTIWLTGNTGTVYVFFMLDLKRDGPTVIEMPGKAGPGFLDDAWMRWVCDFGPTGLDRGQGGTYVILPPDYEGDIDAPPQGGVQTTLEIGGEERQVFVVKPRTYMNWSALRGFLVNGKPDFSVNLFKEHLKVYPLKDAANPPEMHFHNMSGQLSSTIFPRTARYFKLLDDIVQREPLEALDPESRGLLAAVGIEKGEPFPQSDRWIEIYEDAAAIADGIGRTILYAPRDKDAYIYPDRQWYWGFVGGSHEWLRDGGRGGIHLDARITFFYGAIAVTPAMVLKMIGKGSQYAFCARDKDGAYLDGSKTYRLTIPPDVPAKDFWSIVLYDPQTRAMLQTGQRYPALNSVRSGLQVNDDGSVDLYFGPEAPQGWESNWAQTVPGKGWIVLFRIYGPLEPWFDKTWKLNDFELIAD